MIFTDLGSSTSFDPSEFTVTYRAVGNGAYFDIRDKQNRKLHMRTPDGARVAFGPTTGKFKTDQVEAVLRKLEIGEQPTRADLNKISGKLGVAFDLSIAEHKTYCDNMNKLYEWLCKVMDSADSGYNAALGLERPHREPSLLLSPLMSGPTEKYPNPLMEMHVPQSVKAPDDAQEGKGTLMWDVGVLVAQPDDEPAAPDVTALQKHAKGRFLFEMDAVFCSRNGIYPKFVLRSAMLQQPEEFAPRMTEEERRQEFLSAVAADSSEATTVPAKRKRTPAEALNSESASKSAKTAA